MKKENTTMQITKDLLKRFNKRKYDLMSKQGVSLTNEEFLNVLLESFE